MTTKFTYLKALIGDNGDFIVSSNGIHAQEPYRCFSVWMVPGTWTDKYDDYRVERFANTVSLTRKVGTTPVIRLGT